MVVATLEPMRTEVATLVSDLIEEEKEKIAKNEKIRDFAAKESIIELVTKSEKVIAKSTSVIGALDLGYIPILDAYRLEDIDIASKYGGRRVKEAIKDAPLEALEALEVARDTGVFSKIKIQTDGVDPILVGYAGGKDFLIASWLHLPHGKSVGFRYLPRV